MAGQQVGILALLEKLGQLDEDEEQKHLPVGFPVQLDQPQQPAEEVSEEEEGLVGRPVQVDPPSVVKEREVDLVEPRLSSQLSPELAELQSIREAS